MTGPGVPASPLSHNGRSADARPLSEGFIALIDERAPGGAQPHGPRRWPGAGSRRRPADRPRPGWHAYRPDRDAAMPNWAVEVGLTIERPPQSSPNDPAPESQALLLVKAAGPVRAVAVALGTAVREVNSIAGVEPLLPSLRLVPSHPEPYLDPLPPRAVLPHLRRGTERGRPVRHRRGCAFDAITASWEAGSGAVLTCSGPAGLSAQAVVALGGHGEPQALRPPPGGAVVVRAWRLRRVGDPVGRAAEEPSADWALACGVVLAAPTANGLGRVARRYAVLAREAGWDAEVPTGTVALELARAGDPRHRPPTFAAQRVPRNAVTAILATCLGAADDHTTNPYSPGR